MLFGAHVSVSSGFDEAVRYAASVGCECLQLFAKSPRQWHGKPLTPDAIEAHLAVREELAFGPVFTHTAYLINLATDDDVMRVKSVAALADELVRAGRLRAHGVVTHLGNDPAQDPDAAARRVAEAVLAARELAGEAAADVRLLLENTAGAGRTFGSNCAELAACVDASGLPPELLGVCIDTCHLFAYGEALDTSQGWDEVVSEIETCLGLGRLGLIHANDCKFERGSRKDRHEWIGDGFIGQVGFSAMVCHPRLAGVPVVTEMPGEVPAKDEVNVARLKAMRDAC